jgi:hypothetical protein
LSRGPIWLGKRLTRLLRLALPIRAPRSNIKPIVIVEDGMAGAKRELGRTGLQVTTLGYGAMELRGALEAALMVHAPNFGTDSGSCQR